MIVYFLDELPLYCCGGGSLITLFDVVDMRYDEGKKVLLVNARARCRDSVLMFSHGADFLATMETRKILEFDN